MEILKWIKKYPRISWEPEILISGGILFTLFQTQDALILLDNYLYPLGISEDNIDMILGLATFGVSALTIGFSIHLICKAFWISLLALKSVYPEGIKEQSLNYSKSFSDREGIDTTLNSKIHAVGNASSLLFAVSILTLLLFAGLAFYAIILTLISHAFNLNFDIGDAFLITMALPFIDFISMGFLKKYEVPSKVYYPYYKVISFLTLSFLYREILYTLISNNAKWKTFAFFVAFFGLTMALGYYNLAPTLNRSTTISNWSFFDVIGDDYSFINRKYENLRHPNQRIWSGTIQSDIITDNFVKIYRPYRYGMDAEFAEIKKKDESLGTREIVNSYLTVKINGVSQKNITWLAAYREDINQYGLVTYVPISNLESGQHLVEVTTEDGYTIFGARFWKN